MKKLKNRILNCIHNIDKSSIETTKYAVPLGILCLVVLSAIPEPQARYIYDSNKYAISQDAELHSQTYTFETIPEQSVTTTSWVQSDSIRQLDGIFVEEITMTIQESTVTNSTISRIVQPSPSTTLPPISPPVQQPTTTVVVDSVTEGAFCPQWWDTALSVGWTEDDLPIIDRIMWAESRCRPDAISRTRDYGLMQVNRKVWRNYVEARGYVMDDLLDPSIGLMFALFVAQEAEAVGWCRYQPWYMSGRWC